MSLENICVYEGDFLLRDTSITSYAQLTNAATKNTVDDLESFPDGGGTV